MPPPVPKTVRWARHNLSWAASRETWKELSLGLGLLLSAAGAWWFSRDWAFAQQVLLWSILLVILAVLSRRGWLKFFGPVLFYDLTRLTRRSRYFQIRFLYATGLAFLLYWQFGDSFVTPGARVNAATMRNLQAAFAEAFFVKFMIVQFILVAVLTPVYAGSAVAEEKERKTLEYLLATDLHNRELVLSKLASRGVHLALIVLTGLPVLSFLQFMGGVDPDLVLVSFAATGLTVASLASLSILNSVYARKPRDAILLSYLAVAAYLALGYLGHYFVQGSPSIAKVSLTWGANPLTVEDVVEGFNAGNLPKVLSDLNDDLASGKTLAAVVPGMFRGYLICHGLVALVCAAWAVARVRAIALRQSAGTRRKPVAYAPRRHRPRVGALPMIWKEIFVEPGFRLTGMGWLAVCFFVTISLVPVVWVGARFLQAPETTLYANQPFGGRPYHHGGTPASTYDLLKEEWTRLGMELNPWIRIMGTAIACLMLLGVAARASTSISGERDRETLDALLTTPLHSHDILFAKWLGSLLSVRWAWLWLGLIWGVGLLMGGIHPYAIVLSCLAWLIYASCFAGLGLWFSTACKTSLRATLWTLTICVGLSFGHWLLMMCCLPLGNVFVLREMRELQAILTPPGVLYWMSAATEEFGKTMEWDIKTLLAYLGLLFLWPPAAMILWSNTRHRFRKLTSRMPYQRPELRRPPRRSGWGRLEESEEWENFESRT
jgi:ABC-type transport system involved in multi-copper enzyme maturation permease subunit